MQNASHREALLADICCGSHYPLWGTSFTVYLPEVSGRIVSMGYSLDCRAALFCLYIKCRGSLRFKGYRGMKLHATLQQRPKSCAVQLTGTEAKTLDALKSVGYICCLRQAN